MRGVNSRILFGLSMPVYVSKNHHFNGWGSSGQKSVRVVGCCFIILIEGGLE